jgi:hypothetical protein
MHGKFLKYGSGNAESAVEYLLQEHDHKGVKRDEIVIGELSSDPAQFAELINSLDFKTRYSSFAAGFHPDETPTDEQRAEIEREYDRAVIGGLDDAVQTLHVWHREGERWDYHILVAKVDLETGKYYNPAPPGWQLLFDSLRDHFNAKYGWKSPDIEAHPENARRRQPSFSSINAARAALNNALEGTIKDPRDLLGEHLEQVIVEGLITNRHDMLHYLHESGFKTPRVGKDYITVQHPSIEAKGNKVRLKGAIFNEQFTVEDIIRREETAADRAAKSGSEKRDPEAAKKFYQQFEERLEKRASFNRGRYRKELTQAESRADLVNAGSDNHKSDDHSIAIDNETAQPARNTNTDARVREELQRAALRTDRSGRPQISKRLARHQDYKQTLTSKFLVNAVSYRDMKYVDTRKQTITFTDGGSLNVQDTKIVASKMSDEAAADRIVEAAKADEWDSIQFSGSDEFVSIAMRKAIAAGLSVSAKDERQDDILKSLTQELEDERSTRIKKQLAKGASKPNFSKSELRRLAKNRMHSVPSFRMERAEAGHRKGSDLLVQSDDDRVLRDGGKSRNNRVRRAIHSDGRIDHVKRPDTIRSPALKTIADADRANEIVDDALNRARDKSQSNAGRFRDIASRSESIKNAQLLTKKSVSHQVKALGCDAFIVGIRDNETSRFMNKHYSKEDLTKQSTVNFLRSMNSKGNHIYIKPDGGHGLILVDDIDYFTIEQMSNDGRNPVISIETSPGNYQAWFRVGHNVDDRTRLEVSRLLCEKYGGDPGSIGSEHFGRLAGFTNRKAEHLSDVGYPLTKIDYSLETISSKRVITDTLKQDLDRAFLLVEADEAKLNRQKRLDEERKKKRTPLMPHDMTKLMLDDPADIYYRLYQNLEQQYGEDMNKSKADFMIAQDLIRQYDQNTNQVQEIILNCSPDCYDRKNDPELYARLTAEKAYLRVINIESDKDEHTLDSNIKPK